MPERVPAEQHVREFARSCVRSGLLGEQQLYDEVLLAVTTDLPDLDDPEGLARSWVAAAPRRADRRPGRLAG